MATIRQLSSGKWNIQIRIKGSPLKSKTVLTKEDAEKWAYLLESSINKDRNTIASLTTSYLKEVMTINQKKRGGHDAIGLRLDNLGKYFNDIQLEKMTSEMVSAYKVDRLKTVSNGTVRLELQLLSRFLRWAASEKGVNCSDVVKPVKLPPQGKPRDKILTYEQYQQVIARVPSSEMKAIIIIAWETAMRRNEILSITPSMINANQKVIHLSDEQTKNGEGRDVPLSSTALNLLLELSQDRYPDSRIFKLQPYSVTQAFRRVVRILGIDGVCFHSLRHTCITRYAEKGLNTIQLQCISGHKDITMLARYSHIKASSVAALMG